jgi:hypothetical protein
MTSLQSGLTDESTDKRELPRIYDSVPEVLKAKKSSKSKHNLVGHLESLKELLADARLEVIKHAKKYSNLKSQMQETSCFKDDIVHDFERVRQDMLDVEKELRQKRVEIEQNKTTIIDLKDQIKHREDNIFDVQQDNTRFVWGIVYGLHGIKQKFDSNEFVKTFVDGFNEKSHLLDILSKEINDPERCKGLSLDEKKEAIMHLITVISDITTTLHSENKRLLDNGVEAKELRHKLEHQKLEFDKNINGANRDREQSI